MRPYACKVFASVYTTGINITAPARKSKGSFAYFCAMIGMSMGAIEKKRVAIFIDGGNFYRKIRENDLVPIGQSEGINIRCLQFNFSPPEITL